MENNNNATQAPIAPTSPQDIDLNSLTNDEVIDLFIRGIMEEKGTNYGTEEIEATARNDLKNELLTQIDRSLIAELPDDKLSELDQAVERGEQPSPDAIAKMIQEAGIDTTEVTGATMARFREIYLGESPSGDTEE